MMRTILIKHQKPIIKKGCADINKVINTLKERCSFDYIYALNGSTQLREVFRVIPDSIMILNPPQDFDEFYRTYDGIHQNFSGHGWMSSNSTVCLTLYSVSDMEKKKKELKKDANLRLTGYCKDHNIVCVWITLCLNTIARLSGYYLPLNDK